MYILPDLSFLVIFFLTFYNPVLKIFFFDVNLIRTKRTYLTIKDFWFLEEKMKSGIKLSLKEEEMQIKGYYEEEVSKDKKETTDFESEFPSVIIVFITINIASVFWIPLASNTLELLINNNFKYWFFILIMLFLTLIISFYSIWWLFIRVRLLYTNSMYIPYIKPYSFTFPRPDFRKWEFPEKKDKYRLKNEMILTIASVLALLYVLKNIFLIIIVFFL